jgi:hypothetical protein
VVKSAILPGLWTNPEEAVRNQVFRSFVPKTCAFTGTSDAPGSIVEREKPGFLALVPMQVKTEPKLVNLLGGEIVYKETLNCNGTPLTFHDLTRLPNHDIL